MTQQKKKKKKQRIIANAQKSIQTTENAAKKNKPNQKRNDRNKTCP